MKYDEERMKIFVDGKEVRVESLDLIVRKDSLMSSEKYEIEINGIEPIEEEKEEAESPDIIYCKECGSELTRFKPEEFAMEEEKESKSWPQEGDEYWFLTVFGQAGRAYFSEYQLDKHLEDTEKLSRVGNLFRTKQEAEQALERQKAIVRVNNRIEELSLNKERDTEIYLDLNTNEIDYDYEQMCRFPSVIDLVNNLAVGQIISEMEDDLKLIFNIESN